MKRLLKSWVFWAFVAVPVAVTLARFTYRYEYLHVCALCYVEQVESQWRFGVEGRWHIPLWPSREETRETRVHLDGWAGPHEHLRGWSFSGTSPGRIYDGTNGLLSAYETNSAFRAFLLAKREKGEIEREAFLSTLDPFPGMTSAAHIGEARRRARFAKWWGEFETRRPFP
jgi:hypothetical protein